MTRRFFTRVLLSLLLLMSQQMAISHAMSHWAGSRDATSQQAKAAGGHQERGVSAAFAQDQTCEQCLAFAQISSAVGSAEHTFPADGAAACALESCASQLLCARTNCVFQSRAPPSFA
jgi:hypothetical protein